MMLGEEGEGLVESTGTLSFTVSYRAGGRCGEIVQKTLTGEYFRGTKGVFWSYWYQ